MKKLKTFFRNLTVSLFFGVFIGSVAFNYFLIGYIGKIESIGMGDFADNIGFLKYNQITGEDYFYCAQTAGMTEAEIIDTVMHEHCHLLTRKNREYEHFCGGEKDG